MTVLDGQLANQTTFNGGLASKSAANTLTGIQTLSNVDAASGGSITNIQRLLNALSSFTGCSVLAAYNVIPTWTSNYIGASTNSIFTRVDLLTDKFSEFDEDQVFTGAKDFMGDVSLLGRVVVQQEDNSQSGTGITLTNPTAKVVRLTNGSLVSISDIDPTAPESTQELRLLNDTGNTITIVNGAILTGTGDDLAMLDESALDLIYDTESNLWRIVGGTGGGLSGDIISASEDLFNGDGVDTTFTLSVDPLAEENIDVYVSGVRQEQTSWSLSGTTLTFSEAPPSGTSNIAVKIHRTLPLFALPAESVTDAMRLLNTVLSASGSGTYSMSSTTPADVTNLTASFTPSGTKPVEVTLEGTDADNFVGLSKASGTSVQGYLYLYRDATLVKTLPLFMSGASGALEYWLPAESIKFVDPAPAAGTYTYKIQAAVISGTTIKVYNVKMRITEK